MSVCSGIAFKMAQAPWTGFSSCSAAVEMVADHVQAAIFVRPLARQLCSCEFAPPGVHRPSAAAPGCGSGSSYHSHGTARAICASGAGRQTTQAGGQASGFQRAARLLPAHELLLAAQPLLLRQIFPQLH